MQDLGLTAVGGLWLDVSGRVVWAADGRRINLTEGEMDLFLVLVAWKDRPLSRNEISLATRGRPASYDDRSVDVMVMRLRRKLGRCGALIRTITNAGYLIDTNARLCGMAKLD